MDASQIPLNYIEVRQIHVLRFSFDINTAPNVK